MTVTQARTAAMHSPLSVHETGSRPVENADGGVYGSVIKALSPQPPLTFHLACLKQDYMLGDDDELRGNERN